MAWGTKGQLSPVSQVSCQGDAPRAGTVLVGTTPSPIAGRGEGQCFLAGSTGSGKPAAWLGFCLGGYLRVFSRVCQPQPPPCFHKRLSERSLLFSATEQMQLAPARFPHRG